MNSGDLTYKVHSLHSSTRHTIVKETRSKLTAVKGFGIRDDAHFGKYVKHRYLSKQNPTAVNLRQVHFMDNEIYNIINQTGVSAGKLGENITTSNIDYSAIAKGTLFHIRNASFEITGFRKPCILMNKVSDGLLDRLNNLILDGHIPFVGLMSIVVKQGTFYTNDIIRVESPIKNISLTEV